MSIKNFGIGALSRETGCNIETIRYYERIGLIPEPPRSNGGHRSYSRDHLRQLAFVMRSRALGFSISEIRQLLSLMDDNNSCEQLQSITVRHLKEINRKIEELTRLRSVLESAADKCAGGTATDCPVIDILYENA
ncbi:helix-turn-helix domain-containing protein [uncultured Sneathiella sp.]|uniref:MerR family transcriptional regulator n=1 Tax=uncultured Sneathiella sp. TaxID=879315 RepID=UPI0030ED6196|tara:strand:+ start:7430 stop:7834 length:405 start_codon:yes stop_codon:yes gene_type:complete